MRNWSRIFISNAEYYMSLAEEVCSSVLFVDNLHSAVDFLFLYFTIVEDMEWWGLTYVVGLIFTPISTLTRT